MSHSGGSNSLQSIQEPIFWSIDSAHVLLRKGRRRLRTPAQREASTLPKELEAGPGVPPRCGSIGLNANTFPPADNLSVL
jgi:hypothetical protein